MKPLESLRLQLLKDYPGDHPAFGKLAVPSEEAQAIFNALIIPVFEKIKTEFEPYHFLVNIMRYVFVTRFDIKDGCSYFFCSVKINRNRAFLSLQMSYTDYSLPSEMPQERILYEEKFDLSKIYQDLPEDLLVSVFSDTFVNRKIYLKKILEAEKNEERERQLVIQEELRSRLVALRRYNQERDPDDRFRGRINVPDADYFLKLFKDIFGDDDTFCDEMILNNDKIFDDDEDDY